MFGNEPLGIVRKTKRLGIKAEPRLCEETQRSMSRNYSTGGPPVPNPNNTCCTKETLLTQRRVVSEAFHTAVMKEMKESPLLFQAGLKPGSSKAMIQDNSYLDGLLQDGDGYPAWSEHGIRDMPGFGQLSSFCNYMEGEHNVRLGHQFLAMIAYHVESSLETEVYHVFQHFGLPTGTEPGFSGTDWGMFCYGFLEYVAHVIGHGFPIKYDSE